MTSPMQVETDIRKAGTIPSRVYYDPELYNHARERIFERSWQLVGDTAQLKAPGHVIPFTLLEGCLDEALVLTRSNDGIAHCLSNVCTHRGTIVVEGEGHLQTLRCRYHGRRFDLDGCFKFMPEFDEVEDFPSDSDNLPSLSLHEWGPFFFSSLDPMCDFGEWIRPVAERMDWLRPEKCQARPDLSQDYLIQANWALYCDNYLEGFHVPYVHAGSLGDKLDYEQYHTEVHEWGSVQIGIAKDGEPAFDLPKGHPDYGKQIASYYFWLFPNLMLNFYLWGISVNIVQPIGLTTTRIIYQSYVSDASKLGEGAGSNLYRIEMEDEEIVESAQKGVRSRLYDRGRYSPSREKGPHHFHRLLASFLG